MRIALFSVSYALPFDGVRLISALLKREGHSVLFVSLPRPLAEPYSEGEIECLYEVLKDVELCMISVYSTFSYRAVQITRLVRKRFPGMPVIWGGPHCVASPKNSLLYADGLCCSEGDECVVQFVKKLETGDETWRRTPNMAFGTDREPVINEALPPFKDLDGLPFYDYSMEDEYVLDKELFPLTKKGAERYFTRYPLGKPTFWMLTMRGCLHRCSYCNNVRYIKIFGRNVIRQQSVDRFMQELEASLETLDFIDTVGFGDDDFLLRSETELGEFAQRYKRNVGFPFSICVSARTFSKKKVEILLECGLKSVQIGVQSGSQRVLTEVYNRSLSVTKTKKVISQLEPHRKKFGLQLLLDFIIDNPYETPQDIMETYRYLVDIPQGAAIQIFKLCFFPGTPIYERAVEDGYADPFDAQDFRGYGGNIQYQINYPTFLIVLFDVLHRSRLIRLFPKRILRGLARSSLQSLFEVLPMPVAGFLIKAPPRFTYVLSRGRRLLGV